MPGQLGYEPLRDSNEGMSPAQMRALPVVMHEKRHSSFGRHNSECICLLAIGLAASRVACPAFHLNYAFRMPVAHLELKEMRLAFVFQHTTAVLNNIRRPAG